MIREILINTLRPYYFKGKGRLINTLINHEGQRQATVFGYQVNLDLGELIQRNIYLGTFEPQETRWIRGTLKPGMTFLDVGANVGYFSLLASSLVQSQGSVHSIEPSPGAYNRLEETIKLNGIKNIKANQMAFGSESTYLDLPLGDANKKNHSPSFLSESSGTIVRVKVMRLDDYLNEQNIETVDLMKVDVEGFEPQVLRGGSDALTSRRIRGIFCEFNDFWLSCAGSSPHTLYRTILEAGFVDVEGEPSFRPGCVDNRFFKLRSDNPKSH